MYWLLYIKFNVIPFKENVVQFWIPISTVSLCVLLFIRPRVHLLKLDKNNGKVRTLYYLVAAAVIFIPIIISTIYLDSATGKLTELNSIREISKRPPTKYYKPNSYVLFKNKIGIESVMSYSGKRNQYLNFDIYIAMPFTADLQDTLQSPAAFLSTHYHEQISSKIPDSEQQEKWENFWNESFEKFDSTQIKFTYLEKIGNNEKREHFHVAAKKSDLYQTGGQTIILNPIREPFNQRNGNKLLYIILSFVLGFAVWFFMVMVPGLHVEKSAKFIRAGESSAKLKLGEALNLLRPVKGFTATPVLILVNILVFIFMALKGLGVVTFYSRDLIPLGAIYEPAIQKGEWWRLITGMFLHGGIMHLFMNMVSLYLAGVFLEKLIHTKRFVLTYLLSGVVAGLVSLWWHDKPMVAIGASGAIFGLYGTLLALIAFRVFDAAINKFLLILLACTAGYSLIVGFLSEGIDNSAHLGGLAAGFMLGIFFVKALKNKLASDNSFP